MGDLFAEWRRRADVNSRRAVEVTTKELPDFRRVAADRRARAGMIDFEVFLRERTAVLAAENRRHTKDDLELVAATGRERGAAGISPVSARQVVLLHLSLVHRVVQEAAGPYDVEDLMRALRWIPQGRSAAAAYTRGVLLGQQRRLSVADRVQMLADLVLAGDPMATDLATNLTMTVPERCLVLVARIPEMISGRADPPRAEIVESLLTRHWLPISWRAPEEFIALVGTDGVVSADDRALAVARDFGQLVELPCAVGAAECGPGELAAALEQARQVCQVAPLTVRPGVVFQRTDLFAELSVAKVPRAELWLRDVARRIADGPDLIATLDSFYRNNMARTVTAAALRIHPRTLDYRLQRVRELTGLDPLSVKGVRILSTAVTRALAGAWR
jgi:hypothetical protein